MLAAHDLKTLTRVLAQSPGTGRPAPMGSYPPQLGAMIKALPAVSDETFRLAITAAHQGQQPGPRGRPAELPLALEIELSMALRSDGLDAPADFMEACRFLVRQAGSGGKAGAPLSAGKLAGRLMPLGFTRGHITTLANILDLPGQLPQPPPPPPASALAEAEPEPMLEPTRAPEPEIEPEPEPELAPARVAAKAGMAWGGKLGGLLGSKVKPVEDEEEKEKVAGNRGGALGADGDTGAEQQPDKWAMMRGMLERGASAASAAASAAATRAAAEYAAAAAARAAASSAQAVDSSWERPLVADEPELEPPLPPLSELAGSGWAERWERICTSERSLAAELLAVGRVLEKRTAKLFREIELVRANSAAREQQVKEAATRAAADRCEAYRRQVEAAYAELVRAPAALCWSRYLPSWAAESRLAVTVWGRQDAVAADAEAQRKRALRAEQRAEEGQGELISVLQAEIRQLRSGAQPQQKWQPTLPATAVLPIGTALMH